MLEKNQSDSDLKTSEANQSIVWTNYQLSYVGKECYSIPPALGKLYGKQAKRLDASYNCLMTLTGLESFENLEELVLDNNLLGNDIELYANPKLKALSLNKNKITHLEALLNKACLAFPNLTYLSLLGNDACPDRLSNSEKDEDDYKRYRYFVLFKMPKLLFLDSSKVKANERRESQRVGQFMNIVRVDSADVVRAQNLMEDVNQIIVEYEAQEAMESPTGAAAYGKLAYKYTGKHSEGNRFIRNHQL